MLQTLLSKLAAELDIENEIQKPESEHYTVPLAGTQIDMFQHSDNFLFKTNIETLPHSNLETLLRKTMEANLYGWGSRDTIAGLNANGTILTLTLALGNEINYRDFFEKLEDFISLADFWRSEIQLLKKG